MATTRHITAMPDRRVPNPPSPSPSTLAILSLTQDITALLSLSLEATASGINDWIRSSLFALGLARGEVIKVTPTSDKARCESGRGLAVVLVNADEPTGQSLCLQLARSGYTVFPLLPLPGTSQSTTTSPALSSLLLAWSSMQKRLRRSHPSHPGAIVPILTDPESPAQRSPYNRRRSSGPDHTKEGRFRHAGETIRAYLKENRLKLVAVVCASRNGESPREGVILSSRVMISSDEEGKDGSADESQAVHRRKREESPDMVMIENQDQRDGCSTTTDTDVDSISAYWPESMASSSKGPYYRYSPHRINQPLPQSIPKSSDPLSARVQVGLMGTDESTLLSLYRANVLDPLTVIRELQDLLGCRNKRNGLKGRIVFIDGQAATLDLGFKVVTRAEEAVRVVSAARREMARLLRSELGERGLEVCEVAVGPMSTRGYLSEEGRRRDVETASSGLTNTAGPYVGSALGLQGVPISHSQSSAKVEPPVHPTVPPPSLMQSLFTHLPHIWAVDDALLFSSVRRAIEDRYPRQIYHAGLSPVVGRVVDAIPGSGIARGMGRWVLGRLIGTK